MMSRRALMIGGGILAAGAAGASMLSTRPNYSAATAALWSHRDPTAFEGLVHYATLAANSHNAQAWRFQATPQGVVIQPDLSRALSVADPDNHHLFASIGCASENLILAAGSVGRSAALAFDAKTGGPVAIALGAAGKMEPLFHGILDRQSTRSDYEGRAVPRSDLNALAGAARVAGAEVMLVTDASIIGHVLDLVLAANAAQVADPAFAAELKSWLRFNPSTAVQTGDGLYASCSGNPTLPTFLGRFMFDRLFTPKAENDRYARQIRSSAGLAVVHSDTDTPAHWVQAGRCCQRFALQATILGIRHAFVNQPVEVATARAELQRLLGLGNRHPDLVLRFGYGPPMPRSLRRPLAAVIDA